MSKAVRFRKLHAAQVQSHSIAVSEVSRVQSQLYELGNQKKAIGAAISGDNPLVPPAIAIVASSPEQMAIREAECLKALLQMEAEVKSSSLLAEQMRRVAAAHAYRRARLLKDREISEVIETTVLRRLLSRIR